MAAPTFVTSYQPAVGAQSSASPKTISVTCADGDVLVVVGCSEGATVLGTPTGQTGFSWTSQQSIAGSASQGEAEAWTAVVGAGQGQTFTCSVANSASAVNWGYVVFRFSGSNGVGTSAKGTVGTDVSQSLTTSANSAVVAVDGDWNAVTGTNTIRTVNSNTPTTGNGELVLSSQNASHFGAYAWYHPDTGGAGSNTYGVSAPTGRKDSLIVVEVLGTAAAAAGPVAGPLPFPAFAPPFIVPTAQPFQLLGDQTTITGVLALSGSLVFAGTAGAAADTGTVTGSLTFAGTAAAAADTGSVAGSLTFAGAVNPAPSQGADPNQAPFLPFPPFSPMFRDPSAVPFQMLGDTTTSAIAAATGSLTFAGTAGAAGDTGSVSGSLTFAGTATAAAGGGTTFNGPTFTGFTDSYASNLVDGADTGAKSLGTCFYTVSRTDVSCVGGRVYCPVSAGTAVTIELQVDTDANGKPETVAATVVSATIPSGTWVTAYFPSPVLLSPGTNYWIVAYANPGASQLFEYGLVAHEFDNTRRPTPADFEWTSLRGMWWRGDVDVASGNGSFDYSLEFPQGSFNASWYGVDPIVTAPVSSTLPQILAPFGPPFGLHPDAVPFQLLGDTTTPASGGAAGSLTFDGTAAGVGDTGSITGALTFGGTATAIAGTTDQNQAVPGVAWMFYAPELASFQLLGDSTTGATTADAGSPAGSLTFAGTAGASGSDGNPAGSLTFSGTAAAAADTGTVSGSIVFNGTASVQGASDPYQAPVQPFPPFVPPFIEPNAVPFQLQGDRTLTTPATSQGGTITFGGSVGAAGDVGNPAGSITLSGNVTAAALAQAAGQIALTGLLTAQAATAASGSITFTAQAGLHAIVPPFTITGSSSPAATVAGSSSPATTVTGSSAPTITVR